MDLTVLLALDDEPGSYRAAAVVARWLPPDAMVVALHLGQQRETAPGVAWPMVAAAGTAVGGYPYATGGTLPVGEELQEMAREVAGRAEALLEGDHPAGRWDRVSLIRRVAADIRADLVVVGAWPDRDGLSGALASTAVAADLAAEAPCSVLVVREPEYVTRDDNDWEPGL